jgi:hypothetical protein
MTRRLAVLILFAVCAVPATAHAGWYFEWIGGGWSGPYATYDDCQARRYLDDAHLHSNLCMEHDRTPDPSTGSKPPLPTQRLSAGVVVGPGWGIRDAPFDASGGVTTGFHVEWRISGNPRFALVSSVGVQLTRIVAETVAEDPMLPLLVPIAFGVAWTPGNDRLRFDVGAQGGFSFGLDCPVPDRSCFSMYGELHVELDVYRRAAANGFGAGLVFIGTKDGGLSSPGVLLRLSFLRRNPSLR